MTPDLSALQIEILRLGAKASSWGGQWITGAEPCSVSVEDLQRRGLVTIKQDPPESFGAVTVNTPAGWSALAAAEDAGK